MHLSAGHNQTQRPTLVVDNRVVDLLRSSTPPEAGRLIFLPALWIARRTPPLRAALFDASEIRTS